MRLGPAKNRRSAGGVGDVGVAIRNTILADVRGVAASGEFSHGHVHVEETVVVEVGMKCQA